MTTYTTTAKHALRWLTGSNIGSDIDAGFQALAEDLDSKIVIYGQSVAASMPTSSVGSPGKQGRIWWATDLRILYYDTGTGWEEVKVTPGYSMMGSTADTGTLGSGYQAVPGLSGILTMRKNQLAALDAGIMLDASSNDGAMAFWAVNGTGGALLTGAGHVAANSGRQQVPVGALYQAPADGDYSFTVYATNQLGGGIARGANGESWARVVIR